MKIIDTYKAFRNEDPEIFDTGRSSISILADDGRALFEIHQYEDGNIEVRSGITCKHGSRILEDRIVIYPRNSSSIEVHRVEWQDAKQGK